MFKRLVAVAALTVCVANAAIAAESIITPAQDASCKTIKSDRLMTTSQCVGPNGYGVAIADEGNVNAVVFGRLGREDSLGDGNLSWRGAEQWLGSRIEWRMTDGRPYAALVDTWRRLDDDEKSVEEILVVKVTPSGSCQIGRVNVYTSNSLDVARKLADSRGKNFQCDRDKPIIPSSAPLANELDGRISPREALDHNGSLMMLTRSNDGDIDIKYWTPREGLPVTSGTLLFHGRADNAGRLTGIAYTYKPGCAPAGYPVHGERTNGVLELTGAAPRRDRSSCAITAITSNGTNSRLIFYHEAIEEF
jgi:hypothetical protein